MQYRSPETVAAMARMHIQNQQHVFHGIDDTHTDIFCLESENCAAAVPRGSQHERAPDERRMLAAIQNLFYAAIFVFVRLDGFEAFGAAAFLT